MADPTKDPEIQHILYTLELAFGRMSPDEKALRAEFMANMEPQALKRGIARMVQRRVYKGAPTVGEIREYYEASLATTPRQVPEYWQAMGALGASLRGELSETEFYERFGHVSPIGKGVDDGDDP